MGRNRPQGRKESGENPGERVAVKRENRQPGEAEAVVLGSVTEGRERERRKKWKKIRRDQKLE
jgi:hypothetical protein